MLTGPRLSAIGLAWCGCGCVAYGCRCLTMPGGCAAPACSSRQQRRGGVRRARRGARTTWPSLCPSRNSQHPICDQHRPPAVPHVRRAGSGPTAPRSSQPAPPPRVAARQPTDLAFWGVGARVTTWARLGLSLHLTAPRTPERAAPEKPQLQPQQVCTPTPLLLLLRARPFGSAERAETPIPIAISL